MSRPLLFLLLAAQPFQAVTADIRPTIERAAHFGRESGSLVFRDEIHPFWAADGKSLAYRVDTGIGEQRFIRVDLETGVKSDAFEHQALAAALTEKLKRKVDAHALPIETLALVADSEAVIFRAFGEQWRFDGKTGTLEKSEIPATDSALLSPQMVTEKPDPRSDLSPDGTWRAVIRNHNLAIEPTAGGDPEFLTSDGSEADAYHTPFLWSPDSAKLAAYRARAVEKRKIYIVQSTPKDQLQPKLITHDYAKPGDDVPLAKPHFFDVAARREIPVDDKLFATPWEITEETWSADSAEFRFVYNQRGHQVMRVVGMNAENGSVRVIHEEKSATFIDYSQKYFFRSLQNGAEFLWASERSGYNHLYRFDTKTGTLINAVTTGDWNVREVVEFDEAAGSLLLKAVGLPGSDPYHAHFVRVKIDGSSFTRLTDADGDHALRFSPDRSHYLATWSRVDQPPVTELRCTADGGKIAELERADDSALRAKGWSRPERFTAKGRDGKTDIYGIIIRPLHFDPVRKYPMVEDIYAGPHDHFVPKSYRTWSGKNAMAEHGFIIVNIDGMGTNWRGKAFHDVCWKNLMDSGFPDRIPWIKAAAATRPWMDLSRVGIFGGSAGGQSTLAGMLNHGDFYHVGVADCGCHDNRMDKIWWNEAWMGWPVDESYERNSNATHAAKLKGKLMLVVGELDHNVDPASTYQVLAALQEAGHAFDFVPIINAGHGAADTPYGNFRRAEFLVRHLRP